MLISGFNYFQRHIHISGIEFGDIALLEPGESDSVNDNVAESPIATDNVVNDDGENKDNNVETDTDKCSKKTDVIVDSDKDSKNNNESDTKLSDIKPETEQVDKNKSDSGKSTADSGECPNLTRTITTKSENSSATWKRRLFFQNEGSKFMENFMVRIRNNRLQRREGKFDKYSHLYLPISTQTLFTHRYKHNYTTWGTYYKTVHNIE